MYLRNKRTKGTHFEQVTLDYLESTGFKFIQSNFTIPGGEIDLVMRDGEFIVFVEVKSLDENSEFSIYESITKKKKRFLKRAINAWLLRNNCMDAIWRVDFIGITGDRIEHFEFIDLN